MVSFGNGLVQSLLSLFHGLCYRRNVLLIRSRTDSFSCFPLLLFYEADGKRSALPLERRRRSPERCLSEPMGAAALPRPCPILEPYNSDHASA